MSKSDVPPLIERTIRNGKPAIAFNLHKGQWAAWESEKRIIAVIAGGRSGKTAFGPLWLHREMKRKGPGDYLIAAPNYPLLDKAAAPEVQAFFGVMLGLGRLNHSPLQFQFSPSGCARMWPGASITRPPRIIFSHAEQPESLEAMSAKAAWLDEAGQARFRLGSWEAVQQRLSIDQGRCLITTKPFNLGWLKQKIYDVWDKAKRNHPVIDVINYGSAMNPVFPAEELERARMELPRWKYNMHYLGLFERPAGRIYDCFDSSIHVVEPFPIPEQWIRYGGLDFGGVNTAAVKVAQHPQTKQFYLYQEYHAGSLTARGHAEALRSKDEKAKAWFGGSKSEGQWRREFSVSGMPVAEPTVSDVEVGIQRVYAMFATGRLVVMRNCENIIDDIESYSREVDDAGEPLEKIADKDTWHRLDALRYLCTWLEPDSRRDKGFAPRIIVKDVPRLGNPKRR